MRIAGTTARTTARHAGTHWHGWSIASRQTACSLPPKGLFYADTPSGEGDLDAARCMAFRKCKDRATQLKEGVVGVAITALCAADAVQKSIECYTKHLLGLLLGVAALICEAAHMMPALFQLLLALRALLQLAAMSPLLSTTPSIWRSPVVHLHSR